MGSSPIASTKFPGGRWFFAAPFPGGIAHSALFRCEVAVLAAAPSPFRIHASTLATAPPRPGPGPGAWRRPLGSARLDMRVRDSCRAKNRVGRAGPLLPDARDRPGSDDQVPLVPSAGSATDHCRVGGAIWGEPGPGQYFL